MKNFVIIIVDQMSMDCISLYKKYFKDEAYLAHWVDTPNLDRMINEGVSFTRSYTPSAVCCPARASLFTSRMPVEHGVICNNIGIDRNVPNMGEWFGDHSDYTMHYCGKWHAGGKWNCPQKEGARKIPGMNVLPIGEHSNGSNLDYKVSQTVSAFVRNYDKDKPFILVSGLLNPHDICFWAHDFGVKDTIKRSSDFFDIENHLPPVPPNMDYDFIEPDKEHVKPLPPHFNAHEWQNYLYDYCRMVEKIDSDVEKILNAVEDRDDDTFVIFTSDHGDGLGRHGRIEKWHPYEGSNKIPLIFWNPKSICKGFINNSHFVNLLDIFPTICDYTGVEMPPHSRGLSLKPLLEGKEPGEWRDHIYIDYEKTGRIIISERYKYVMKYKFSGNDDLQFIRKEDGVFESFGKGAGHTYEKYSERMLFDLEKDPWEKVNLYNNPNYKEVLSWHEEKLKEWEEKLIPGMHYDRN